MRFSRRVGGDDIVLYVVVLGLPSQAEGSSGHASYGNDMKGDVAATRDWAHHAFFASEM